MTGRKILVSFFSVVALLLSSSYAAAAVQQGVVMSGDAPIGFASVALRSVQTVRLPRNGKRLRQKTSGSEERVRSGDVQSVVTLGSARADANGAFTINYTPPSDKDAVLYVVVRTGEAGTDGANVEADYIRLMTVLGRQWGGASIVVNERTTVAAAYAMAQFFSGTSLGGASPGLQNAAGTSQNLASITDGEVARMLAREPNGLLTNTMRKFNALANILAACVNDAKLCEQLFELTEKQNGQHPLNTLEAIISIAHQPLQHVDELYALSLEHPEQYTPTLIEPVESWVLAIRYDGNGQEFDGPGNVAFDADGNAWIVNNYKFGLDPHETRCAGNYLIKLTPTGEDAPGAPFYGGGVSGAGFGVTLDPDGNVWIGNFGFKGEGCTEPTVNNSVSKFAPDGTPLSPPITGFNKGGIDQPQGTISDQDGNIWIVNCSGDSVTRYAGGDHNNHLLINDIGLSVPFDAAVDHQGRVWVTSNVSDEIAVLDNNGEPVPGSPFTDGHMDAPMGIAVDSGGNIWAANSGLVNPPCPTIDITQHGPASLTALQPDGTPVPGSAFSGGGLHLSWGIAVDGNDNIWVANFGNKRVSHFCGVNTRHCPAGINTGDPIAPDGYYSDGLVRNTGVQIDSSGNVWLANNWLIDAYQTNPGGHSMVVFIGLAAPVKTPLIGPPRQP